MTDRKPVPGLRLLLEDTFGLIGEVGSNAERATWIRANPGALRA